MLHRMLIYASFLVKYHTKPGPVAPCTFPIYILKCQSTPMAVNKEQISSSQ